MGVSKPMKNLSEFSEKKRKTSFKEEGRKPSKQKDAAAKCTGDLGVILSCAKELNLGRLVKIFSDSTIKA